MREVPAWRRRLAQCADTALGRNRGRRPNCKDRPWLHYISRNYRPGDRIFIVGFSRGAYTARALAGMIAAKGLLDATQYDLEDKEPAYRLGVFIHRFIAHMRARAHMRYEIPLRGPPQITPAGVVSYCCSRR